MKNRGKMPQQKGLYSPLGKYDAHFRRELPGEVDFADHATEPATLPNNEERQVAAKRRGMVLWTMLPQLNGKMGRLEQPYSALPVAQR